MASKPPTDKMVFGKNFCEGYHAWLNAQEIDDSATDHGYERRMGWLAALRNQRILDELVDRGMEIPQ